MSCATVCTARRPAFRLRVIAYYSYPCFGSWQPPRHRSAVCIGAPPKHRMGGTTPSCNVASSWITADVMLYTLYMALLPVVFVPRACHLSWFAMPSQANGYRSKTNCISIHWHHSPRLLVVKGRGYYPGASGELWAHMSRHFVDIP